MTEKQSSNFMANFKRSLKSLRHYLRRKLLPFLKSVDYDKLAEDVSHEESFEETKAQSEQQVLTESQKRRENASRQVQLLERNDVDFVAESRESTLSNINPYPRAIIYIIFVFLIIGIVWAYYGVLEEVTTGTGKVIPSSQVKHIQNLEGGILQKLFVKEGQVVKKGQVLARLDDTRFSSDYRESKVRALALQATIARLIAEANGDKKITFPEVVLKSGKKDLIQGQVKLFESRKKELDEKLKTLQENYNIAKRELDITKPLVEKGIMSKIEMLRLERDVNKLKGQISDAENKFRKDAETDLRQKEEDYSRIIEALRSLEDRMTRTTILSPVHGIVKQVNINTVGGVIKPGDDIMEIVPLEDSLLIEAKITPQDIAFIHPGQEATVKITAYDYSVYGGLEGKVEYISADSTTDDRGNSYFEVWIRTNKNYLGTKAKPLPIIPGMTASVHILTGNKSVLDYIMKPLLKAKQNALTER